MKPYLPHLPFLLILWTLSLAIYIKTLEPSILYIDAGTMVAAAYTMGIPNPPGFPTYMLIAHLFTKIPIGDILFRVQLVSIFSAIGVLTLLYFVIYRLITSNFYFQSEAKEDKQLFTNKLLTHLPSGTPLTIKIISLASCFALAFSYQFWSQTLNAESYLLTNLFMMILLTLVLTIPKKGSMTKRTIIGSLLLGLATGANPTIVQVVPALFLSIAIFSYKRVGLKNLLLVAILTTITTFLIYSYLPLRASTYPFVNWGNPQTWELFWGHIKGSGLDIYDPRTNSINGFTGSPSIFAQSFGRYFYLLFLQFTPILLPFILIGIYYLFIKNRPLTLSLITIPITNLIFGGLYLSGNQESWFIASYIIFSIFLGIGFWLSTRFIHHYLPVQTSKPILSSAIILIIALIPLLWWFSKLDRSSHVYTTEYMDNLYQNLPQNAILIGSGDFFNSASLYQRTVANKRPDIFPITANMWYILPWYRDNLRHQNPAIMPQELESMIKMDRYEEYREVMNWYIEYLINKGYPVFVTPLVFRETVLAGTDMGKYVVDEKKLKAVPMGLSSRILTASDLLQAEEKDFQFQFKDPDFYKHPPFYLERNYNGGFKNLMIDYATAYLDYADILLSQNNDDKKAEEYIKKAYNLAPFSPDVLNRLGVISILNNRVENALNYFKQALKIVPADLAVRMNYANTLLTAGQFDQAKQNFELVQKSTDDPSLKAQAQDGLIRTTQNQLAQVPPDWKRHQVSSQNFSFAYPGNWTIQTQGTKTIIKAPEGNYSIELFGGKTTASLKGEWLNSSPLRFSGQKLQSGKAQIPGYDADAIFWQEGPYKVIEFVLALQDPSPTELDFSGPSTSIVHVKVQNIESKYQQNFDRIILSLKFN